MDTTHFISKTSSLEIRDLPADVLTHIFSLLHGQDIARCILVCRVFSDLIHADLYLQYKIELAQNGMVDGESSTLPVFERLQRLRQYSSNFKRGTFQHEGITAHPDYVLRDRELWWPRNVLSPEQLSGCLYEKSYQEDAPLYLSLFVPGSAQGGIPSSRSLHAIRGAMKPDDNVEVWAMDDAQDLFIIAVMDQVPDVHMHFYSVSGLKTDMVMPHPAATLPFIRLHVVDSGTPRMVYNLHIVGDHVVFEMGVEFGADCTSLFVDVYNWKTGQMVWSFNLGMVLVSIIPLDEPYLLLLPCPPSGTTIKPEHHQKLLIYNFFSSSSSSTSPGSEGRAMSGPHVCALELPPLARPGENVTWSGARVDTGDRADETTGHFRADPSRSIIVFSVSTEPIEGTDEDGDEDEDDGEYTTYLLIPRTTLSAQISAAESRRRRDPTGFELEGTTGTNPPMLSVPWADWGPRGCLRICPRNLLFHGADADCSSSPFGSRMPFVVFDGPEKESASVYVFDVNPLVAHSVLAAQRASDEPESDSERELEQEQEQGMSEVRVSGDGPGLPRAVTVTAVVDRAEDIEEVLPGVVDPECAAIPYVVYRFPLPDSRRADSTVPPEIRQVAMSMAGFTVKFGGNIEYEKRFQTWTV